MKYNKYIVGWGPANTISYYKTKTTSLAEKKTDKSQLGIKLPFIIKPGDPLYNTIRQGFNSQVQAPFPKAIYCPDNKNDVSKIVRKATKDGLKVTARGGGHSYTGQSTSPDIIISFWNMRSITINNNNTAWIEPGIRNFELGNSLYNVGYVFPIGTCPGVGVAGFILGGGIGFLSRKFGLACDSLLDAEIILANGSIMLASKDPELLGALKGAGQCNFGIITRFLVKIYPIPSVNITWNLSWNSNLTAQVIKKWQNLANSLTENISMNLTIDTGGGSRSFGQYSGEMIPDLQTLLGSLLSIGKTAFKPQIHKKYIEIIMNLAGVDTVQKGLEACYLHSTAGFNHLSDFPPVEGLSDKGIKTLLRYYTVNKKKTSGFAASAFDLYGGAIKKGNGAYIHRDKPFQVQHMNYLGGKDIYKSLKWQINMYNSMTPYMSGETYQNYPSLLLELPLVSYFGKILPKLIELRNKYDRNGIFFQNQNIPHSLNYSLRLDNHCGTAFPSYKNNPTICNPIGNNPCCFEGSCILSKDCGGMDYSKRRIPFGEEIMEDFETRKKSFTGSPLFYVTIGVFILALILLFIFYYYKMNGRIVLIILSSLLLTAITFLVIFYSIRYSKEKFTLTPWGPISAMRTVSGKNFYKSSKTIKLNQNIINAIEGKGRTPSSNLEWICPHDPKYSAYSAPHNGQIDVPSPWGIALPTTNDQVIEACNIAYRNGLKVTARGGGHSYIGASSSNQVIISFEKMKGVKTYENYAWVDAGTRLGELYYGLFVQGPYNFPGGVCPTVGVAGFALGGGEGLLQRKFGLGCDSFLDAEMIILQNGKFKVIPSIALYDPVLMKALRGGGQCNFGLITKLKLRIYPVSKYYAIFTLKWPIIKSGKKWRTDVWKAFQGIASKLDNDISCYYAIYMPRQPKPLKYCMIQGQYSGNKIFNKNTIDQFLGPLSKLDNPIIEIQTFAPKDYLKLPLQWAGVSSVDEMLKQCQAYGTDFPQENFNMMNDHYGINDQIMPDNDVEYMFNALQEFFDFLPRDYPGWAGYKWDMQQGKIKHPSLASVTLDLGLFATAQYMYYFWTGEGGGGGVAGARNLPPTYESLLTTKILEKQLEMYQKLTNVVTGTTYVNYPLHYISNPLWTCYRTYMPLLIKLKNKYDPSQFWYQPANHMLPTHDPKLWRNDRLCGMGFPTVTNGLTICNPYSDATVCDFRSTSSTYRHCIPKVDKESPLLIDYSKRQVISPWSVFR